MTTVIPYHPLPVVTGPFASGPEIVSSLLQFAECFGVSRDGAFEERCCGLAFTNAVALGCVQPDGAARLREILRPRALCPDLIMAAGRHVANEVADGDSWLSQIRQSLTRFVAHLPGSDPAAGLENQIITMLLIGLEVVENHPDLADSMGRRVAKLNDENIFLARLLLNWSRQGFRPLAAPFVEYVHRFYQAMPVEQAVMCDGVRDVLNCAHRLEAQWRIGFWAEEGWARGRHLVEEHPALACKLLGESSEGNRRYTLRLFREQILRPAQAGNGIDLERATLAYFALAEDGAFAIEYCAGVQPRKLARLAFDFAFWMGIISAIPVPTAAE